MSEYRNVLYSQYNSTLYGSNSSDLTVSSESYDNDYLALLPQDKGIAILDIGCGMGQFLYYLKTRGYQNIQGVDHSAEQVDLCLEAGLPVELISDLFEYLRNHQSAFDAISMNDVLEHFTKDEIIQLLSLISKCLRDDGSFILRVPNSSGILGSHGRYLDFTHEVGFTESSLRQVLQVSGFNTIEIRDNTAPFGFKPKRFLRWVLFKLWRSLQNFILLIEAGEVRPKLLGKVLIAKANK